MGFDFKAAAVEANADAPEPFVFEVGTDPETDEPRRFEMSYPFDLLAMDKLGRGDWVGCIRGVLGEDAFDDLVKAMAAEQQKLSLGSAKALMDEYFAGAGTSAGESEASTESSSSTATL